MDEAAEADAMWQAFSRTRHILEKCAVVSLIIFLEYNKQNRDWKDIVPSRKSDIRRGKR